MEVPPPPTEPVSPSPEIKINRPKGWDGALIMAGTLAIWVLAFALLAFASKLFGFSIDNQTTAAVVLMILIQSGAFIAGPVILAVWYLKISWRDLGFIPPARLYLLLALSSGVVLAPLASILAEQINPDLSDILVEAFMPEEASISGMAGMFLAAGLITPFAEELLFRGVLLNWLRNILGPWPGIVISAAVFGLIHIEPTWALIAGLLGLYMGWLYVRSGSIWASIAFHVAYNSTGLVLLYATN